MLRKFQLKMLLKIRSMIFFQKTTEFTHTMYFFKIQQNRFRQNGFWRIGTEPNSKTVFHNNHKAAHSMSSFVLMTPHWDQSHSLHMWRLVSDQLPNLLPAQQPTSRHQRFVFVTLNIHKNCWTLICFFDCCGTCDFLNWRLTNALNN